MRLKLTSNDLVREMRVQIANEMADSEDVETDPARALEWFKLAADAGSEYAAARVGMIWVRGDAREGVTETEAVAYLEEAVENHIMVAYQTLGYYWAQVAQPTDPVKARELYEKARIEGVYAAHLALEGDRSIKPMILRESMELARRDAPPEDLPPEAFTERQLHALFATGFAAWVGVGEDLDRVVAAHRFQRAADRNHPEAAYYTGMAYLRGYLKKFSFFDGRAGDKKAFALLEEGTAHGSDDSLYMLGVFNHYGISLNRPDYSEALRCFTELRDHGDVKRGAFSMGNVLIDEENPYRDIPRALEAFTASAEAGEVDAMVRLAYLFTADAETGVDRDLAQAREWAEKAIEADDDARGHYYLGRFFELSDTPDLERAYSEYEEAAIGNHPLAMEKVAKAYMSGENAPHKPLVAARYYRSLVEMRSAKTTMVFVKW